ncbi:MAG: hypothetical protein EOP06_24720 [Proteobacteria bacterium]|nr:MAG: hypothetical protein EOP06_24720 [Pseudomonadota bacterium]
MRRLFGLLLALSYSQAGSALTTVEISNQVRSATALAETAYLELEPIHKIYSSPTLARPLIPIVIVNRASSTSSNTSVCDTQ